MFFKTLPVQQSWPEVLLNSLNSRGPDELREHIPCRAMENAVWHVSSNTIGNPRALLPHPLGRRVELEAAGRSLRLCTRENYQKLQARGS